MKVAIDAVGIRGHGGAAVLCELLCWLPKVRPEWQWHVFLFERDLREFDDPPVSDSVTIEHTRLGNKGWERLKWVKRQLQDKLKPVGADLLFSFANIASNNPCIPQIVFVHQPNAFFDEGIPRNDFLMRFRMKLIKRTILAGAKRSNAVIVQTETMRRRILIFAPELKDRINVIPSGFRTPSLNPVIRPEKKALIDGAGHPTLIYVSHPTTHKNHANLFEALPRIKRVYPSFSLILTLEPVIKPVNGYTEKKYNEFMKPILQAADKINLSTNIVWTGVLNNDEVRYALMSSDVMVFPSLSESFGLGLVEAMEVGCPIAASDLSYARDVAHEAAVYFNPIDPESIAEVVINLLQDARKVRLIKESALRRKDFYNYKSISNRMADIFYEAYTNKSGGLVW
jgi:glycosyltransferase involved in cell wall biosynthesis